MRGGQYCSSREVSAVGEAKGAKLARLRQLF